MIRGTIRMEVPNGHLEDVTRLLRELIGPARAMPGCLDCCLCQEVQTHRICFTSEWETEENLRRFIKSESFRSLLIAMDLASEKPSVRFETVSHTLGMDYINSVRRPPEEKIT